VKGAAEGCAPKLQRRQLQRFKNFNVQRSTFNGHDGEEARYQNEDNREWVLHLSFFGQRNFFTMKSDRIASRLRPSVFSADHSDYSAQARRTFLDSVVDVVISNIWD
jgi:hypothetical protein